MDIGHIDVDLRNPAIASTVEKLRGTEKVVPPLSTAICIPPFERYPVPNHGERTLLIFPTENEGKVQTLLRGFKRHQRPGSAPLLYRTVPVESNVGEQPYNEAGAEGARNRISNGLRKFLATPEERTYLEANEIGTVVVACIESFIQIDDGVDRPTDFGVVVIFNAATGKIVAAMSQGVTVAPEYVEHARSFGIQDGNINHGLVTVGNVLAANVPGLDKADWHAVVAGRSRYDILDEAIDGLRIPW
ncbi:hypothetical protein B0T22DRAFT_452702 [Podospora appendiculata]|uniref:Uncharacterized protein n=1 Tax=Podospora appendiculata TaxID=314037 RepID=A0AAE0XJD8_9PEZI|nr:hypothetical protein B0T22DRAFT_452702 [Podospora appendiculata]